MCRDRTRHPGIAYCSSDCSASSTRMRAWSQPSWSPTTSPGSVASSLRARSRAAPHVVAAQPPLTVSPPGPAEGSQARGKETALIITGIQAQALDHVILIVRTHCPSGQLAGNTQRRKQNRHQHGNDRDNHQQFDQCKPPGSRLFMALSPHRTVTPVFSPTPLRETASLPPAGPRWLICDPPEHKS